MLKLFKAPQTLTLLESRAGSKILFDTASPKKLCRGVSVAIDFSLHERHYNNLPMLAIPLGQPNLAVKWILARDLDKSAERRAALWTNVRSQAHFVPDPVQLEELESELLEKLKQYTSTYLELVKA